MIIMVLILYSAATAPLRVCFDADAEGIVWLFEASMSLVFITDMSFSIRTAFFDNEKTVWVVDGWEISKRYLLGWFWIDGPSSLPVEFIELALPPGADASSLTGLRMLRMFRLIRLLR